MWKLKHWVYHLAQLFHFENEVAEAHRWKRTLDLILRSLLQAVWSRPPPASPQVLPTLLQWSENCECLYRSHKTPSWLTKFDGKSERVLMANPFHLHRCPIDSKTAGVSGWGLWARCGDGNWKHNAREQGLAFSRATLSGRNLEFPPFALLFFPFENVLVWARRKGKQYESEASSFSWEFGRFHMASSGGWASKSFSSLRSYVSSQLFFSLSPGPFQRLLVVHPFCLTFQRFYEWMYFRNQNDLSKVELKFWCA